MSAGEAAQWIAKRVQYMLDDKEGVYQANDAVRRQLGFVRKHAERIAEIEVARQAARRSDAAKRANETRGAHGRSEAARKANATRKARAAA
jgi:hypothetical protein